MRSSAESEDFQPREEVPRRSRRIAIEGWNRRLHYYLGLFFLLFIWLFSLTGLSNLADGSGVHVMTFFTEHQPFLWLNQVIAVGEGSIDPAAGALLMRYYICHVDYRPGIPAGGTR